MRSSSRPVYPSTTERRRLVLPVQDHSTRIAAQEQRLGWRAYATHGPRPTLPLAQAVLAYRDEWLIERDCARLKGRTRSLRVSGEDHVRI